MGISSTFPPLIIFFKQGLTCVVPVHFLLCCEVFSAVIHCEILMENEPYTSLPPQDYGPCVLLLLSEFWADTSLAGRDGSRLIFSIFFF